MLSFQAAEASGILLGMNTGEFSGAIDSQLPFPSDIGDLDMDIGSDDGSLSESILPQNVAPGEIVFGTGMGASGSVPTTITHLGGGNREAPPPPRRSARKVTATATREDTPDIDMVVEGESERMRLLREVKKSFDNLQASKRNLTTNERWGQLFGLMIDEFPVSVQDDFKFYVQCLAIATKRGLATIPNAHKVLTGDWVVEMTLAG